MHAFDCEITFTFRFDLRVNASAKTVNIPDVQHFLLKWFLDKNELKSTTRYTLQ